MARVVDFDVPPDRVADRPPEARGMRRDDVRLMVVRGSEVTHARFFDLADQLDSGDVLVVNTSATMPAALFGRRRGTPVIVHLSGPQGRDSWIIEVRLPDNAGPVLDGEAGETIELADGASAQLMRPVERLAGSGVRLWTAQLTETGSIGSYVARHGRPIRYSYVPEEWSLEQYQTIFARSSADYSSAEMPSAARPFTPRVLRSLRRKGVRIAPVTLHTGVSSQEAGEYPQPERFAVPRTTALRVQRARQSGARVIAVGTTAARAIESAVGADGHVVASSGWTSLVLGPQRSPVVVNGIVTGWHPPGASHLELLEAVGGPDAVISAYRQALDGEYLWHEFGDSCLFLPERRTELAA